jgi:hypothetical protein
MCLLTGMILSSLYGCSTPVSSDPQYATLDNGKLPQPNFDINIPGLSPCTTNLDNTVRLNDQQPVTVIVHGCFGSAAQFRALAQVFAFHGQQTVCFNYNDRDSLMQSSTEFINAIKTLNKNMRNHDFTVIGHSQGGLIARKALIKQREDNLIDETMSLRLVTISSPYAGISAADHCASTTMRVISFGLIIPICKIISGDKWFEITHASDFIREPGDLLDQVGNYLKIVTDERGTCREYDPNGLCLTDDFVFSTDEQYQQQVDTSSRVENVEVAAGHAEIVGNVRVQPLKLISVLQKKGIMRDTPPSERDKLATLLKQLY